MLFAGAEANSVAFDGAGDNRLRSALGCLGAIQRRKNRAHVVAVNHFGCESLGFEFAPVRFHIVLIHGGLALPQRVDVGDHCEVFQFVMAREFRSFPDLTLGHFAVAQKDIHACRTPVQSRADRQSRADGKPLAE